MLEVVCINCGDHQQGQQSPPQSSCPPESYPTFAGEEFSVVRYHSLAVVKDTLPSCLEATAWATGVLPSQTTSHTASQSSGHFNQQSAAQPAGSNVNDSTALQGSPTSHRGANGNTLQEKSCGNGASRISSLQHSDTTRAGCHELSAVASNSETNGSCHDEAGRSGVEALVIMGLAHKERPHIAVQFHPESVATAYGAAVLQNFRDITLRHLGLPCTPPLMPSLRGDSQDLASGTAPRLHSQIALPGCTPRLHTVMPPRLHTVTSP